VIWLSEVIQILHLSANIFGLQSANDPAKLCNLTSHENVANANTHQIFPIFESSRHT